LILET